MVYEVIQSNWFWPTLGVSIVGYYLWVMLSYFKSSITKGFRKLNSAGSSQKPTLQLNWDELAMAFELHRRLIINPLSPLDQGERSLLGKSPFRELIKQTTIQ
jgi:hypothetical protein